MSSRVFGLAPFGPCGLFLSAGGAPKSGGIGGIDAVSGGGICLVLDMLVSAFPLPLPRRLPLSRLQDVVDVFCMFVRVSE